jgi:hypothetical protein
MAQAPRTDIIRSGHRDYNPPALDMNMDSTFNAIHRGVQNYVENADKRYKESTDFYDIQKQETDDLTKFADGLEGEDYKRMMEEVVTSRDKFAKIFKGKKLRDYNNPEFQAMLFEEKKKLAKVKNGVETYKAQLPEAYKYIESTPSVKKQEAYDYVKKQGQLPPSERDPDVMSTLRTDPLFFNAYDFADSAIKGMGGMSKSIIQTETPETIIVTEKQYNPEIGAFENGKFKFNPSERVISTLLGNNNFRNTMLGMLPADVVKKAVDSGNTGTINEMVKDETKKYLQTIRSQQPSDLNVNVKNKLRETKPTATETKEQKDNQAVDYLGQRLVKGNDDSLNEFITATGSSGWAGFDYVKDENGSIIQVLPQVRQYNTRRKRIEVVAGDPINVNPNDPASVRQLYQIVKNNANKSDDATIKGVPKKDKPEMTLAEKLRATKNKK